MRESKSLKDFTVAELLELSAYHTQTLKDLGDYGSDQAYRVVWDERVAVTAEINSRKEAVE